MKYALISEEQISQILCGLVPIFKNDQQIAIDILQSLKPSTPDAFMTYKGHLLHAADPSVSEYSEPTSLYALDEVTK